MPSLSQAEQIATAIALHHPEKLYPRNRGLLKMKSSQLREFASTPRKGLPKRASKRA
jgi:hypothetical protein